MGKGWCIYFTGNLAGTPTSKGPVHFTVKYGPVDGDWQWVKDQFSANDGEICFQSTASSSKDLRDYLRNIDLSFQLPFTPDTNGHALVWPISTCIAAASDQPCLSILRLGRPRAYTRWFCLVRQSRAWLCPRQGRLNAIFYYDELIHKERQEMIIA